jgi:hypothetical protein
MIEVMQHLIRTCTSVILHLMRIIMDTTKNSHCALRWSGSAWSAFCVHELNGIMQMNGVVPGCTSLYTRSILCVPRSWNRWWGSKRGSGICFLLCHIQSLADTSQNHPLEISVLRAPLACSLLRKGYHFKNNSPAPVNKSNWHLRKYIKILWDEIFFSWGIPSSGMLRHVALVRIEV